MSELIKRDVLVVKPPQTKLIFPCTRADTQGKRIYMLLGPVSGAWDWHQRMIDEIASRDDDCFIVCPRNYSEDHPYYQFKQPGDEGDFANLEAWERFYIHKAMRHGCAVYWLAAPEPGYLASGKPFGVGTYGELGRWGSKAIKESLNMCIGAEEDFPGLDRVAFNLMADYSHRYTDVIGNDFGYSPLSPLSKFRIFDTIETTAEMAVSRAKMF